MSDPVWPYGLQPTRLLCPWDSPGKNTEVGCRVQVAEMLTAISQAAYYKVFDEKYHTFSYPLLIRRPSGLALRHKVRPPLKNGF